MTQAYPFVSLLLYFYFLQCVGPNSYLIPQWAILELNQLMGTMHFWGGGKEMAVLLDSSAPQSPHHVVTFSWTPQPISLQIKSVIL